jgi:hypothetical protein
MQFIHTPALVTHSRTSSTAHPEVVVPTPISQTTVTPMQLDFFLVIVVLTVTPARFVIYYNCSMNYCIL